MHLNLFVIYSLPGVIFFLCDLFLFLHFKNSHQALRLKDIGNNEHSLISSDMCLFSFFKSTSIEMLFEITSLLYANVCVNARI